MKNKSMFFFCLCGEATKITGYMISFLFFSLLKKLGCIKNKEQLLLFETFFSCAIFLMDIGFV